MQNFKNKVSIESNNSHKKNRLNNYATYYQQY